MVVAGTDGASQKNNPAATPKDILDAELDESVERLIEPVERVVFESSDMVPSIFDYSGNQVRTVVIDGEPMFHGGDVCKILGYVNTSDALKCHCKYAKILRPSETLGLNLNPRGELFIPESDLYRLTLKSNMPHAEHFQDWVCEKVLPTLRKTGRYQIGVQKSQAPAAANFQDGLTLTIRNKPAVSAAEDGGRRKSFRRSTDRFDKCVTYSAIFACVRKDLFS